MTRHRNRVALVTGAGSGIGAATALLLAKEGAHVCCADLQYSAVEESPAGVRTPMWRSMPFFQDLMAKAGSEHAAFEALEPANGERFAEPEDVARAVTFLASDGARNMNGVELLVDGGLVL